jgi:ribosomal peptide maturation radical SAM protein 1
MKKVLLVSMPFGALERQALGISLLKAKLNASGIPCDLRYFTFTFAELVGLENYRFLGSELPYTAFAGDWLFTAALYGEDKARDNAYLREVLQETWHLDDRTLSRIVGLRAYVPHFLDYCLNAVPWQEYSLVGFTSTFEQNIASLALAKKLKARYPKLKIIFGGANWEGEMGLELHRQFPFVDYVCSGEADESFPALVRRLNGDGGKLQSIPGLIFRDGATSVYTGQAALVKDMDALPVPDFTDYFQTFHESSLGASVLPNLLMETSRGCWWGAKSHCTFCGLNGGAMGFRSKSPERVMTELLGLTEKWQTNLVEVVDNILDMRYFKEVLPKLAALPEPIYLFYEIKANLTRAQVKQLAEAGIRRVQPGIESLSDHVLRLMRKGTTGLRNIQLLKWCKEYGIEVDWNILYGFPGETKEDYDAMLALLPAIRFLQPPGACGPIRLDRFSPYFEDPKAFGLTNVRPIKPYRYLYPFSDETLQKLAYYFDYDYETPRTFQSYAADVVAYAHAWKHSPETGTLTSSQQLTGELVLTDTRSDAFQPTYTLTGLEAAVYSYCDEFRSVTSILRYLNETFAPSEFTEQSIRPFLDSLVAHRLMLKDESHYLSLAISLPTAVPPPSEESYARASNQL